MKIAVPVDKNIIETNVSQSFGRAVYFLIYNTETKESSFIDNIAAADQGGAGIKAAQTLVDFRIEALITPRCGQNAANVLKLANIQIYKTTSGLVKDNINSFMDGKLSILDEIHAGFHHHGGK
ncbi:MAG: NifB/NifX family molybdenum-iron cluster-binding protein [Christensenellales bacterium]